MRIKRFFATFVTMLIVVYIGMMVLVPLVSALGFWFSTIVIPAFLLTILLHAYLCQLDKNEELEQRLKALESKASGGSETTE